MTYLFPLIDRQLVAEGTMAFTLDTSGSEYTFKAGQNADYTLINPPYTDNEGSVRTFSFVNSPARPGKIIFTTRLRDTAFKKSLQEIPLGTKIQVSQPMGQFTLPKDPTKPVVFLAGGIGITPFMSMIQWAADQKLAQPISLLYSNRSVSSTAFHNQLMALAQQNSLFHYLPTLTNEQPTGWSADFGPIDEEKIRRHVPDLATPIFYSAGPPKMVEAMVSLLESMAVPEEHIKTEDFAGY